MRRLSDAEQRQEDEQETNYESSFLFPGQCDCRTPYDEQDIAYE